MLLYLVRHGKAEPGGDDAARKLTDQGRKAVRRVARHLAGAEVHVDRIEHSGLARAEETAQILADAVGGSVTAAGGLGATDPVESVAQRIESSISQSLMLVGHSPFMNRLAAYLLTGDAEADILHFRTATVACLSDEDGGWTLEWFLPPDLA
jgi:phosphohistidine phosphatase